MNRRLLFLVLLSSWLGLGTAQAQTILARESFESTVNPANSTTSFGYTSFAANPFDVRVPGVAIIGYFLRSQLPVTGFNTANGFVFGTGIDGSWLWAGEDVRVNDAGNPTRPAGYVQLNGISIAGKSSVQVLVSFADARGQGSGSTIGQATNNWENDDFVRIKVRVDNAATWTTIGQLVGDNSASGGGGRLRQDRNLNGTSYDAFDASSPAVSSSFQDFTFNLTGSGSTLDVMVEVDAKGGSEELAFDNIRVVGTQATTAAPVLASANNAGTPLSYNEGAPATFIIPDITVNDADSPTLTGGSVTLTTGFVSAQDRLSLPTQSSITGTFNNTTGVLTLSGTASLAAYQTALRAVQYQNIQTTTAVGGLRVANFSLTDGITASNTLSRDIIVNAQLNAPAALPYTEEFETDGEGLRYASNTWTASNCFGFLRTTANPYACTPTTFGGISGSGYWYAEGTTSGVNPNPVDIGTLVLAPVNATNIGNLHFNVRLGIGDGTPSGLQWEIDDYVKFFYRVNGGAWMLFGAYFGDGPNTANSGNLRRDANLDGVADANGAILNTTLQNTDFTLPAGVTGASVDFMIEVASDGQEELAMDRIMITGTALVASTVTTTAASSITSTSTVLGGNVTADGGAAVSERGVVYSSSATTPAIGGTGVTQNSNGTGTGTFSETILGLNPGTTYYVRAYAINSVGTSYGAPVSFTTLAPVGGTRVVTNVSCFGGSNGTINLTPTGGLGPYTFLWNTGQTTEDRTGLLAGTYSVTITDAAGATGTVNNIVVTQPLALSAGTSQTSIACFGGSTGEATVNSVSGGTSPYTYRWSTAATTPGITGLTAGNYSVTITDANGCTRTYNFNLTQPAAALVVTPASQTNIACFGGATGSASINPPTGGTPPYNYNWNPGNPAGDGTRTVTGLRAGTYTVTVTDANACTVSTSFTISQPASALAASVSQNNVITNGGNNGSATITVSGGTPGYTYSWSPNVSTTATASNLSAGTYSVTATDANGCTIARSFTITQPLTATVVSVTRLDRSPTAMATVQYQVVFSGSVSGITTSNFTTTNGGGLTGSSVSSTSGSGTTYTVTVNTGTGTGTLRLDVANNTGITPSVTNTPYTAGEVYAIIKNFAAAPQLSLRGAGSASGNNDVTAFVDLVQVVQNGTGTAVTNGLQNGSFESSNVPAGNFLYAGNVVAAPWTFGAGAGVSRTGTGFGSTTPTGGGDAVGLLQNTGASIAQNLAVPTGTYQVNFLTTQRTNQFSDQVVNVFLVEGSNAVFVGSIQPRSNVYDSFTSAAFSVTAPALTATVSTTASSPTSTAPISFAVSFTQPVGTTFTASDVTVTGGTLDPVSFGGSSAGPYTFTVTPTGAGTVAVSLAAGVTSDANNTSNAASNTVAVQYQPPTSLSSVSPAAELPGQLVTLTGTGFTSGSTVSFGTTAASVTLVSATTLTAVVPAGLASGSASVSVSTGGSTTAAEPFTVLAVYDGGTPGSCAAAVPATASVGDGTWHYLLSAAGQVVAAYRYIGASLGALALEVLRADPAQPVRQDAGKRYYLGRNWHLTNSAGRFDNRTVALRLYGLNTEQARLQVADPIATLANLKATQYSGPNEDCQLANNTATGERRTLPAPATSPAGTAYFVAEIAVPDHFSEFYLTGSATPLPVELTTFTATAEGNRAVRLAWTTASEKNSARFDVERSVDGRALAPVGTVAAAGSSSAPRSYELLNAQLPAGAVLLYYRLKQVDLDGTFSYSPVRTVALTGATAGLELYPNPTTDRAATLTGAQPGAVVTVFDALGREVTRATADAAGTAALDLLAGLPAGVYLVRAGAKAVRLTVE